MYHNRYFPVKTIDLDRLGSLLSSLLLDPDEIPTKWYRGRLQPGDVAFPPDAMGAPPNKIAIHGRANPAGIPYLYLGSNPAATISEIRPHAGEKVSVAEFTTSADLKLIDLRSPRKMVSPFLLEDVIDVEKLRNDLPFLERLGDELTRPVIPQSAAIEYIPSQYLCEFIKNCGYQGVLYRSSIKEDGINMALFDPALALCGKVIQYCVNHVTVDVAELRGSGNFGSCPTTEKSL
jgi:hypothetical protein